jgi:hypothetical protein
MAQRIFTFRSPVNNDEMVSIIERVVSNLNGKTKTNGGVVTAKWWHKGTTTFPHKYTFYVGKDVVRVTTNDMSDVYYNKIKWEFKCNPVLKLWNEFIIILTHLYPDLDFWLESNSFHIESAKIMSNGMEQTFSSTSVSRPSIGGALLGGLLFGGVGAIVGGSRNTTRTTGTTSTVFSDTVAVTVRYSNGFNLDGNISKKSSVYNKIIVGLCEQKD